MSKIYSTKTFVTVTLVGNLGADPEALRYTPAGVAVTNISVATNESWKDKQTGEQRQHTEWHRVVFYGLPEWAQKSLRKGSKVWIKGRPRTREWEKEGQKQYRTEIIGDELLMFDSQAVGGEEQWESSSSSSQTTPTSPSMSSRDDSFDDDIPF